MSFLNQVTTEPDKRIAEMGYPPVRINLQAPEGRGKTTFGSNADSPIFLQTEDGMRFIENTARFPLADTWEVLTHQVQSLRKEDHQYKTLVLDTTDAAAKLAEEYVVKANNWKSANDPKAAYGAFYLAEENLWRELLNGLNLLHDERNMNIILLSHVSDRIVNNPTVGEYRAFQMRCNRKVNALIKDWVDFNLFADYDKTLGSDGMAKSSGNRFLYTQYAMGFEAKSRLAIPKQIPLSWNDFLTEYKKALNLMPSTETEAA